MRSNVAKTIPPSQIETIRRARFARRATKAVATVLGLGFAWLKFRDIQIGPVLGTLSANLLFQTSLAAYYFCWIFGLNNDTREQELIYVQPPKNVIVGCVIYGILFGAAFWAMCYVDTPRTFAVALAAFLVFNVISWRVFIMVFMQPATLKTQTEYLELGNFIGLEQLRVIYTGYLCGTWQWIRFIVGGILALGILALAFSQSVALALGQLLQASVDVLLSLLLFVFVLVMEGWIWTMRFGVKRELSLLQGIRERYALRPTPYSSRRAASRPAEHKGYAVSPEGDGANQ